MAPQGIRLQFTKFDGSEHWGADLLVLGEDEHGLWLGGAAGAVYERPGRRIESDPHVLLLPRDDWFVATFNRHPAGSSETIEWYVDIATPPTVAEGEAFAVDLDLDVVLRTDGTVEIDDEDEFAEHQVSLGYPPRVVAAAREAADRVAEMVRARRPPFDGAHERWLARVR